MLLLQIARLLDDADLQVTGKPAIALSLRGAEAFSAIEELFRVGSSQQRWGAAIALHRTDADIERAPLRSIAAKAAAVLRVC